MSVPRNYQMLAGHDCRRTGHGIRLHYCVDRNSIFSRHRVERIADFQDNDDVSSLAGTGGRPSANGSSDIVGGGSRHGLRRRRCDRALIDSLLRILAEAGHIGGAPNITGRKCNDNTQAQNMA